MILWLLLLAAPLVRCGFEENQIQMNKMLKGYKRMHRPVKDERTVTKVAVFVDISHAERVDEEEQTMLIHGNLYSSWIDEYLTWNETVFNETEITVDAWKIWQPALALYNSARGNYWNLYMNGAPAFIRSNGRVILTGSYSFYVTCKFDFTDWPFDTQVYSKTANIKGILQECPVVIADWVYDLSRVNLSDSGPRDFENFGDPDDFKRLKTADEEDPGKMYSGGWQIVDTWKKHCYWGPRGCRDQQPEGQIEWYWSLLEFGVRFQRHVPYFGFAVVLPTLVSILLTLSTFWIHPFYVQVYVLLANFAVQGMLTWGIFTKLPPGSGTTPKIVVVYSTNLMLSSLALFLFGFKNFIEDSVPSHITLGLKFSHFMKQWKLNRLQKVKVLSFDPQEFLEAPVEESTSISSVLFEDPSLPTLPTATEPEESLIKIDLREDAEPQPEQGSDVETGKSVIEESHDDLKSQLDLICRLTFFGFVFIYLCLVIYIFV